MIHAPSSRRSFMRTALLGGIAAGAGLRTPMGAHGVVDAVSNRPPGRVALTAGEDRAANIFNGLKPFAEQIRREMGDRPVVIKPNNVAIDVQLCATHVDCLAGILEFLKSIGRTEDIAIAESAASGPTFEGYENYGYPALKKRYNVDLLDLDQQGHKVVYVNNDEDFRPRAVRMSRLLLDGDVYLISAAVMKAHDRVVATLSLKNIVFGAPIKDPGFRWGRGRVEGAKNDKPIAHGGGFRGVNYNLFALSPRLHPDLAVIDGHTGMEGNGPVGGTPVDHRVAVVSPDWFCADRVGVELMGIDFANVGYLNYCVQAGIGEADLSKIEIVGESVADHVRPYKLHDNVEKQLIWMS